MHSNCIFKTVAAEFKQCDWHLINILTAVNLIRKSISFFKLRSNLSDRTMDCILLYYTYCIVLYCIVIIVVKVNSLRLHHFIILFNRYIFNVF